ncbi:hypothetical protein COCCADRAFT_107592 [Bipolaris zeicola 26-R-13]|uniref:Uncharacterized protein n=1 Tax=Cochliobolus carbonum (strain 26-R-13) TaxID=930089 RepID=W6XTR5_COCC2|nr:uncharacterized protein COCCADRAFT_107592 [Bipolaris zeicola 26-R-13]EUC29038.1 hypothetical protein COCCADRAFT_107592 [Bipolaris zeicola 26-R-13]
MTHQNPRTSPLVPVSSLRLATCIAHHAGLLLPMHAACPWWSDSLPSILPLTTSKPVASLSASPSRLAIHLLYLRFAPPKPPSS